MSTRSRNLRPSQSNHSSGCRRAEEDEVAVPIRPTRVLFPSPPPFSRSSPRTQ